MKSRESSTPTMNNAALEAAIAAQPHEKVTKEGIEVRIKSVDYFVLPNSTTTICSITLDNEYSVRGESACVDPRNFNMEIGRSIAYRNAFDKLWALEGYLLAERRFRAVPAGDKVKKMVDRFLMWPLPQGFAPDCGIKFDPLGRRDKPGFWPVGTNLLCADQAKEMIEYMLADK